LAKAKETVYEGRKPALNAERIAHCENRPQREQIEVGERVWNKPGDPFINTFDR
jgi:hypothetical protein